MKRLLPTTLLLFAMPVAAQGLLIGPAGQTGPTSPGNVTAPLRPGVHIVKTKVHARIVDGVATTTIDQVIRNTGSRDAEGTWFLPLPRGAVADGFTMTVGGKEVRGEVLDATQARSVYESIVRRRRDPGLLEYAGDGMLRARIFPIPANGEVGVTVRLRQVLQPTGGMFEWNWPLKVARLGDAKGGSVGLYVEIESSTPLSTVVTPHPGAEVRRTGEHEARVSVEGANGDLDDLRVLYGLTRQEFGLHLLPYRLGGEPGYFAMLLSPPRTLADAKIPPRTVQLVIDTSGSMKGDKIRQAKASVHTFLNSLRGEDYFQIITFASSVEKFFDGPIKATAENVQKALARVDSLEAMGGTNIADALQEALEAASPTDDFITRLQQIVFVTDGQPTVGVTDPNQILQLTKQADKGKTRVFALGVGDQIDVTLIDDLVEQHRGARDFVGNKEKIEAKVDALCQKISRPALTDVVVKCEGLDAFHVHPTKTRDLFCGEMMQVVGRYRDHGTRTVRVTGKQNGVVKEFSFTVDFPEVATRNAFVQTLWARQHVASLLDEIRHNGQKPELVAEVRRLATRYGIVTPYTSQLIVEESMRLANRPRPQRGRRGGHGIQYRGPGDTTPPQAGAGQPRPAGPATGGPVTGGRATGGPTGPASPAPNAGGGGSGAPNLAQPSRTGSKAIAESKALKKTGSDDFYLGSARRDQGGESDREGSASAKPLLRRAAGRVFVPVGKDLVEQGLPQDWQKRAVVIEAFSSAYFALLKEKPQLREILALGERVVFKDGDRIVHVQPSPPKAEPVKAKAGSAKAGTK